MEDRYALKPYLDLLSAFLSGQLSADDFEDRYLDMFKADTTRRPLKVYEILDDLFADVDSYVADPDLRDEGDLDDDALYDRAAQAQQLLQRYGPGIEQRE